MDEKPSPQLTQGWKLIEDFRQRLSDCFPSAGLNKSWEDSRRTFKVEDYLSLLLIGLFNPTVKTMRGLCAATRLSRLQMQWGCGPMSLGSVSEAQSLVDPEMLRPLIEELSREVAVRGEARRWPGGNFDERLESLALRAVDSTLLAALPRMGWAVYGGGRAGFPNNAVRFHLSFDPLGKRPVAFKVTEGRHCERKAWKENHQRAEPSATSIGDRYFSQDFALLEKMSAEGTHFVVRLREGDHLEILEELPLSEADRAEGVVRQAWVLLGKGTRKRKKRRVRVIWIERPEVMIVLATDYEAQSLPAELLALMYGLRWQVEFFFRWIKCLLGCRHWMAESREGVTLQLHLVLVAALLLQLRCGRRPTRRMMELLQFYFQGVATVEELTLGLEREAVMAEARLQRQKNRNVR